MARLHAKGIGWCSPSTRGRTPRIPTGRSPALSQGGLSLPDREYYLKTDPKSVEIARALRAAHREDVPAGGRSAETRPPRRKWCWSFETMLAGLAGPRLHARPQQDLPHHDQSRNWRRLTPGVAWDGYFQATGAPPFETLNVATPDYFKRSRRTCRAHRWSHGKPTSLTTCCARAPRACRRPSKTRVFDFWRRYLTGAKEQRPRDMRCVQAVDRATGRPARPEVHRSGLRRAMPKRKSRSWWTTSKSPWARTFAHCRG